jgi:hypothetical protein
MATPSRAPVASQKLQNLLRDFQQIASMSGYLNHAFDPPQLRLFFTLLGRVTVASVEDGLALAPKLLAWSEGIAKRLREDSSSTIMTPQIQISAPQSMQDGRFYVVSTVTFATKVTDASYLRIRTAVLAAFQAAAAMRDKGLGLEDAAHLIAPAEAPPRAAAAAADPITVELPPEILGAAPAPFGILPEAELPPWTPPDDAPPPPQG